MIPFHFISLISFHFTHFILFHSFHTISLTSFRLTLLISLFSFHLTLSIGHEPGRWIIDVQLLCPRFTSYNDKINFVIVQTITWRDNTTVKYCCHFTEDVFGNSYAGPLFVESSEIGYNSCMQASSRNIALTQWGAWRRFLDKMSRVGCSRTNPHRGRWIKT
jgi:hypothetical protein